MVRWIGVGFIFAAMGGIVACSTEAEEEDAETRLAAERQLALEQIERNAALPSGFPQDVVVPAEWDVVYTELAPKGGYLVQALVDENVPSMIDQLRDHFILAGWNEVSINKPTLTTVEIKFVKGSRTTNVNFTKSGGTKLSTQLLTSQAIGRSG